jgi:nucleoside-diphosphate-sugar epimerase
VIELREPPEATIITGASGWLGTALMTSFTDEASPWFRPGVLRALVRTDDEARRLSSLSPSVEPVVGDLTDVASLAPLWKGLSATSDLIHTAGVIHPARVDDFYAVNAEGTRTMLQLAHEHGVNRFVHVSSNSPFGTNADRNDRFRATEPYNPYFGYGRSKMQAELSVGQAVDDGLNAVIVRPPWFYGPYQPPRQTKFFRMVRAGRFPILGTGEQTRSMSYVDNLVQGVVRAELVDTPPGRGWWIADARPYTINEIITTVGRALADEGFDVKPNRVRMPRTIGQIAEYVDSALQRSGRYNQQVHVLGEMDKNIACDISAARLELGYDPQIELYEGMRRSIRWCVGEGLML